MVAPRPAPPRAADQDMRGRLLAAATRLFAARGFGATSLQDIADEVGVTKPAVLHHFASKETLRQAVLQAILDHWRDTLPRLLLAATASTERFDAVFGEVYRFFAEPPDRARVVAREALDRPEETRALLRDVEPILSAVAAYVEAGKESGRHHEDVDARAYVTVVLQWVIAAAAVADVSAPGIGDPSAARERFDREVARIAKVALFTKGEKGRRRR